MKPLTIVAARSIPEIEDLADLVRRMLDVRDDRPAPMERIIDIVLSRSLEGYSLIIYDDDECPGVLAHVHDTQPILHMSRSTYDKLCAGDTRARFTAAHELGHLIMHCGDHIHYTFRESIRPEVDPEPQADAFAAAFLMPAAAFRKCRTFKEAMDRFGVGYRAAQRRAKDLGHRLKPARVPKGKGASR